MVERPCQTCGNQFEASLWQVERRWGLYCSQECQYESMRVKKVACTCRHCGKEFFVYPSAIKKGEGQYCGKKCSGLAHRGEKSGHYKGGWINYSGYKCVCIAGKQQYEHRLVAEEYLGQPLGEYVVHHIDGDPQNNEINNLMLFEDNGKHLAYERGTGQPGVCLEEI